MLEDLDEIVAASVAIPGWRIPEEGIQVALASLALPDDATIVEVGVYMGRSTVLLAGPRRLRGNGRVHCVDPFDCSGDAFSVPYYIDLLQRVGSNSLEDTFQRNIASVGLEDWVEIHKGVSKEVAASWTRPIDLVLLDGDQSVVGAREAFDSWMPFLKPGGIMIIGNSRDAEHAPGHEGNQRLVDEEFAPPKFTDIKRFGSTAIAVKQ